MASLIQDLFRQEAYTDEAVPRLADGEIPPEEQAYIRAAVPKRRAEFATARILARRGLCALGVAPAALVPDRDRAPVWPAGTVGSISHTSGYCAVVVDRSPPMRAVGLDVEALREVEPALEAQVMTPREQAWLRGRAPAERNDLMLLFFSAKEAFYKCQYPISRGFLDFLDVELEIALPQGRFEARVLRTDWPRAVARLDGKFAFRAGKVLCGVELT